MLSRAKKARVPITVETCMHYLWFAAEEIRDGATEFKCAPPIRGAVNRDALWQALNDGLIDMVTTDHSPCPPEMRRSEDGRFDLAWGGIASLWPGATGDVKSDVSPRIWTRDTACARGLVVMDERRSGSACGALTRDQRLLCCRCGSRTSLCSIRTTCGRLKPKTCNFRRKVSAVPWGTIKLRGRVLESWLRGEPGLQRGAFCGQHPPRA